MTSTSPRFRQIMPRSIYADDTGANYASQVQEFDLITDSVAVKTIHRADRKTLQVTAEVNDVAPNFLGFASSTAPSTPIVSPGPTPSKGSPDQSFEFPASPSTNNSASASPRSTTSTLCSFVLDNSLAMLGIGVNHTTTTVQLSQEESTVAVSVILVALSPLGILALDYITVGALVGRVFCNAPRRVVRSKQYITRLHGVKGVLGHPVIEGNKWHEWRIADVDGRVVMFIPVQAGTVRYGGEVHSLLPTVGMSLSASAVGEKSTMEQQIRLHQTFLPDASRLCTPNETLMVRTVPFRSTALFGRIVESLLPQGVTCASTAVITPVSGPDAVANPLLANTMVFSGSSTDELTHVPVEFFSLESFREHVPFQLRRTLSTKYLSVDELDRAFSTAPSTKGQAAFNPDQGAAQGGDPNAVDLDCQAAVFLSKGSHFAQLQSSDWVVRDPKKQHDHRLISDPQAKLDQITRYLHQQCEYPIMSAIATGDITSEGVLLTKYFPSPTMKSLLLSRAVTKKVRAIVFLNISRSYGSFFSAEDRNMLVDLDSFGISVYSFNGDKKELYQFVRRVDTDQGMFVPVTRREEYLQATFFGVYGSNLIAGDLEPELDKLLTGVLKLRDSCNHELLKPGKPLALVTGGGPGAMEVGNRVAKRLGILSCGMVVDFGSLHRKPGVTINEQRANPYVDAWMTYRPEKLVERQADFQLDIPIFLAGGYGSLFEAALEDVRRKVCTTPPYPMIYFGDTWPRKIKPRFQVDLDSGTIKNSEWLSTIAHIVDTGEQALTVLTQWFQGTLKIGPGSDRINNDGYIDWRAGK